MWAGCFLWLLLFLLGEGAVAVRAPGHSIQAPAILHVGSAGGDLRGMRSSELRGGAATGHFECPVCGRGFRTRLHLGRHYQCSGHGPAPPVVRRIRRRHSYSYRRKRDLLLELDNIGTGQFEGGSKLLSLRTGISINTIDHWNANREKIFLYARTKGVSKLRKFRPGTPHHPAAEVQLYTRFLWRRTVQRLRTGRSWLQRNMRNILAQDHNITDFAASDGWTANFCNRWDITNQSRSNKHKTPLAERLPEIKKFHRWLIYGLQRSEPQRSLKYGRFDPQRMFHMDQVPLPFSSSSKTTLNMKSEQCSIREPAGSGASKRFCTLQVTICADPWNGLQMKLEIIFRGTGSRISVAERRHYRGLGNITVRWQPKAWCDEKVMMAYFVDFREATLGLGEVLLGMDNHGAQKTPLCRDFMKTTGIQCAFTPADCTDVVSPVDHHVGQALKLKIARRYEETCEEHAEIWDLPWREGGLSASKKRRLVATWASEAWKELLLNHRDLIQAAFVKTGFLIAKDGSENKLVGFQDGGKPYDF